MTADRTPALQLVEVDSAPSRYELRFQPLRDGRAPVCFPCDQRGQVDLDALAEPLRNSYFFARTVIGREFARPSVQARTVH